MSDDNRAVTRGKLRISHQKKIFGNIYFLDNTTGKHILLFINIFLKHGKCDDNRIFCGFV